MKFFKRLFLFILIAVIALAGYYIYDGRERYLELMQENPPMQAAKEIRQSESFTPIEEIPRSFLNAVVAVEDRRFYHHRGIDPVGLLRAFMNNFKAKEFNEGGSTITQQLVKNIYFEGENTAQRKIAEMFMAVEFEKKFTKNDILELYSSAIYYGSGYYNIKDAANGYFGKEPSEMTEYECTLLAGIPNAPSVYSLDENPELAKKRQKKILNDMQQSGFLTEKEAEEILSNGDR